MARHGVATKPPRMKSFSRVIWTGQRFLVSGGKNVWSSPDGLTWAKEPARPPCSFAWAREGWLGLGFSWGGNLYSSTDMILWKKLAIPPGPSLESVAYGAGASAAAK